MNFDRFRARAGRGCAGQAAGGSCDDSSEDSGRPMTKPPATMMTPTVGDRSPAAPESGCPQPKREKFASNSL
jgi:hypothetical protein